MKKKISKFLAVGVTLALMVSLFAFASPLSASTLKWGGEDLPDAENQVIRDCDITDLAVADGGEVIYAVADTTTWSTTTNTSTMFKSTDGGWTWKELTGISINATFVVVTADDADFIAIANDDTPVVHISDDGGSGWDELPAITDTTSMQTIYDLAISPEKSDKYLIAVAGIDDANEANVFYFDYGATLPEWTELKGEDGFAGVDVAAAVEFSPNYASDEIMVAVSANYSADEVYFEIFSHDSDVWNAETGTFADYPVTLSGDDAITALTSASIAMSPTYLGSDDAERIAFVGLDVNGDTEIDVDGIYVLDDDSDDQIKDEKGICSVAYDGTNLVAGRADSTLVYRSANPLSSAPTVSSSASLKGPGGANKAVVAFAGDDVVVGTSGDNSAFALSTDNGKTFNDISLIDSELTNITDVAVSSDGSNIFIATDDGSDFSLWSLRDDDKWERVLVREGKAGFIVRIAPDDVNVVYVADQGSSSLYYSEDAGQDRWQTRAVGMAVQDLALETDGEVVYALRQSDGKVSRSANSGFTWGGSESTDLGSGNMIASLGEDMVIVGSNNGYVSYSTDGNDSWTKLDDQMGSAAVQVIASGLADGDYVYAGTALAGDELYNWKLGDDDSWNEMTDEDVPSTYGVYGIALNGDDLYVTAANTSASTLLRTLSADTDDPTWRITDYGCDDEVLMGMPQGLRMSVTDSVKLWAVSTDTLESFKDTLALAEIELRSPANGAGIKLNPVTGKAYDVALSWISPSDRVTQFDLKIALDEDFDEEVLSEEVDKDGDEGDIITQLVGPGLSGSSDFIISLDPGNTYYWKVRVDNASGSGNPINSSYSEVRSFTIGDADVADPITVTIPPAQPAPQITLPELKVEVPAPTEVVIPAAPPAPAPITPGWIYAIIAIGAVLVIAVIVLIVRTRRVV
jgi:hypothetical protein